MKSLYTIVALSFATLGVACASGGNGDDDTSGAAADLHTADASLSGTFDADGTNDVGENSITFNSNHTYTAMGGCPQNGPGPHCFAITEDSGTWALAKSGPQLGAPGGASELVLTDSFNQTKTLFFTLSSDGKDLSLSTSFNGSTSHFSKSDGASKTTAVDNESLVGTWADEGDDSLAFFTITLKSDATYSAQGGCRPQDHCFAVTHQSGTWKLAKSGPQLGAPAGVSQVVLTDSLGQTTTLFFTLDGSGKDSSIGPSFSGERFQFTKS